MSIWDSYPSSYRSKEVRAILAAVRAGECVSVAGLSGAGKSNLAGFLSKRTAGGPQIHLVDCNAIIDFSSNGLLSAMLSALRGETVSGYSLPALIEEAGRRLRESQDGLCYILDRFDPFNVPGEANQTIWSNLRALRDRYKYQLTYITTSRRPLDQAGELAELFSANTIWLGPLEAGDALWSIRQYTSRRGVDWDELTVEKIAALSGRYPSLMRAVVEAHTSGVPLELAAMRKAPAVRRRLDEFWADRPSSEDLQHSGINDIPLLMEPSSGGEKTDLTALEQRLLDYFTLHPEQVCAKDDLIQAVWPEEALVAGLRDDSLAQLVHRLREKIESGGRKLIQTVPGRGYRYRP